MSYGERSCVYYGRCHISTMSGCNVDCKSYRWDGETETDSDPAAIHQMPLHKLREVKPLPEREPLTKNQRRNRRKRRRAKQ